MKSEEMLHWADEKEVVSNTKPLKFVLCLLSHLPAWCVFIFAYPVSFFYLIFSKRARRECVIYQKQLRELGIEDKYIEEEFKNGRINREARYNG